MSPASTSATPARRKCHSPSTDRLDSTAAPATELLEPLLRSARRTLRPPTWNANCLPRAPRFQPGEIAKIALAIFFAGYLVQARDVLTLAGRKVLGFTFPRGRDLGPIMVAWLISVAVLVFELGLPAFLQRAVFSVVSGPSFAGHLERLRQVVWRFSKYPA